MCGRTPSWACCPDTDALTVDGRRLTPQHQAATESCADDSNHTGTLLRSPRVSPPSPTLPTPISVSALSLVSCELTSAITRYSPCNEIACNACACAKHAHQALRRLCTRETLGEGLDAIALDPDRIDMIQEAAHGRKGTDMDVGGRGPWGTRPPSSRALRECMALRSSAGAGQTRRSDASYCACTVHAQPGVLSCVPPTPTARWRRNRPDAAHARRCLQTRRPSRERQLCAEVTSEGSGPRRGGARGGATSRTAHCVPPGRACATRMDVVHCAAALLRAAGRTARPGPW